MASFEFSFPAIDTGTTFVFGSWVCIANGSGGFSSHLINPASTETPRQEQLGEITSAEILLPEIAKGIENLSFSDSTPTRFPFGLKNSAMSYSALSRQWDRTGTRIPPLFDSYPDSDDDFDLDSDSLDCQSLTIMAIPQSRVVFWKNYESTDDVNNARMVACLRDLPYQPGRPLSPVRGEEVGDTALVDYSTTHSTPDRQVYVSLHGEESALGSQADRYANETLDQISDDELSVNTPQDESQQDKESRRQRNRRHAIRRKNATARAQRTLAPHGPRNLQQDLDEAADNAFDSPLINLAETAILMQALLDTHQICEIQRLTRDALRQIGR